MASQDAVVQGVSAEVHAFLSRRVATVKTKISGVLNVNPFMLRAIKEVHSFSNLFSMTRYMFTTHLGSGDATAFGKMIDEKVLPTVFHTIRLGAVERRRQNMVASPFDDVDHVVEQPDGEFLLSLKASAWSIQHAQAMRLYDSFKAIGDFHLQRSGIVVGVFYGTSRDLTNKYSILRGADHKHTQQHVPLDYVTVKAGKDFWSWLNEDIPETEDWVMQGTIAGAQLYFSENPEAEALFRDGPRKLALELAEKYKIDAQAVVDWFQLLHAVNDEPESR